MNYFFRINGIEMIKQLSSDDWVWLLCISRADTAHGVIAVICEGHAAEPTKSVDPNRWMKVEVPGDDEGANRIAIIKRGGAGAKAAFDGFAVEALKNGIHLKVCIGKKRRVNERGQSQRRIGEGRSTSEEV